MAELPNIEDRVTLKEAIVWLMVEKSIENAGDFIRKSSEERMTLLGKLYKEANKNVFKLEVE